MIVKFFNTDVAKAASMIGVTDQMIEEMSNGALKPVTDDFSFEQCLSDPDIFGLSEDPESQLKMGHIDLPVPVVNVNYLYGPAACLAKLLNMSMESIGQILYNAFYVVIDQKESKMGYKEVFSSESIPEDGSFEFLSGAEAIEALLRKDGVSQEKISEIILRKIPVMPLCLRQNYRSIEYLYARLLNRAARLRKLQNMQICPEIVLINEIRCLQNDCDDLINNGASHRLRCLPDIAMPAKSLFEISENISSNIAKKKRKLPGSEWMNEYDIFDAFAERLAYINGTRCDMSEEFDPDTDEKYIYLEKRADTTLTPYINQYITENYPSYTQLAEEITGAAITGIFDFISQYTEEGNKDYYNQFSKPIALQVDCYIAKRIAWGVNK